MKPLDIEKVTVEGELRGRTVKNFARMHDRIYRSGYAGLPPLCSVGWPGDWEGRAMLALVLDEETLKTKAAYLDDLIDWIYSLMNDEGYRSEPDDKLNLNDINEQMHSAQNWLMRAFMEYYRITGEEKYMDSVKQILRKLYLPIKDHLINYPKTAEDRKSASDNAVIGHTSGRFREWRLSSDVGCLFMSFDALGQAWTMIREEPLHTEIGELIEGLLGEFRNMDYVGAGLQTHATLTCMRGVMRIYKENRDKSLLDTMEKYFDDFIRYGMTASYININSFMGAGHTEPCGAIDSYMLACQLWEETGKRKYLDISHKIWWNAVMRNQRENGGFGCEWTGRDGILKVFDSFYEAYWCCTMRGAEGLGYPVRHALYEDGDSLILPFFFDFTAELDGARVQVRTKYPDEGKVSFRILSGNGEKKRLKLYVPEWTSDPVITENGRPIPYKTEDCFAVADIALTEGSVYEMTFEIKLHAEECKRLWHENEGKSTIENGTLVLGTRSTDFDGEVRLSDLVPIGDGKFTAYGITFEPCHKDTDLSREELTKLERRILFRIKD